MNATRSLARTPLLAVLALVAGLLLVPALATPVQAADDPCGPTGNKISCENSKPGTPASEWDDFYGAGADSIQGFSTEISVNIGQRVDFKIDTDARAYTIDIYRTGYYDGDGARKITSITPSAPLPQNQPTCITDVATELTDCGNWAVSASWNVPSTAVSGVYIARLHRADTDESSHITFIVRDDASTSDVVFQTSDTTWQAYNTYGGSDFYVGGANGRAYKVSYNRPVLTRGHENGRDFYFSAEYAMVRFLERNGYDVTYIAGVDTHRRGNLLTNHETFLSVGHDEYWSGQQRSNVEAARDAGVNLQFLSGNEMYWRTRYEPSADASRTPFRTLVSYKETWASSKIDPEPEWTGTWRDPRSAPPSQGAGRPENQVTGTMYMVNDVDHPISVTSDEGKLRMWRHTTLTDIPSGQSRALAPHTVGYESNEDVDNGFRPAGLIRMSTVTGPTPQYLQDFGNTVKPGTTTHHVTMYKAPSGALVFSAGSVQWAWGLDETHDSSWAPEPADLRMQQAQVNLLADMDAQPTTLQAGLFKATKSTDTTAPTATITSPAAGANRSNGAEVTVSGTASDTGGRVAGVEVSTDAGASWHAATGTTAWSYTYIQSGNGTTPVRARAIDDSANVGAVVSREVNVQCPCSILGNLVPAVKATDDTGGVELGLRFSPTVDGFVSGVRFYKGAGNGGTHVGSLWTAGGQRLAQVSFANETATGWQEATFAEPVEVTAGTTYVVSYTAPQGRYAYQPEAFSYRGLQNQPFTVAGGWGATPAGVYASPGSFPANSHRMSQYFVDVSFTTIDQSALRVNSRSPSPGVSSVGTATNVSGRFSKPVVPGSGTITLKTGGQPIAGTTSYDATTRTITFDPSAALPHDTVIDVEVQGTDALGQQVSEGGTWSFRTARAPAVPGVCPCSLFDDTKTPAVVDSDDRQAVTLGVRFAPTVNGKITGVRFYKGPDNTGTHTGTLWAMDGTVLATGTFTGESTAGWQTLTFADPVAVAKNVEYVAGYRTTVGRYSYTAGEFATSDLSRGPLRVASNSGAYTYGTGFPGASVGTNYHVDVVFERDPASVAITERRPAPDAGNAPRTTAVETWFSAPLAPGATVSVTRSGQAVAGTTTLGGNSQRLTFVPSATLAADTLYSVTVSDVVSEEGATLGPQTWSFRTAATEDSAVLQSVHGQTLPASEGADETSSLELGMTFSPGVDGVVTGVRFFKDHRNTGTHVGTLWSATGEPLATVTFAGETASGWQRASFDQPVAVTAGTTYVVSYFAPNGHYAATPGYFDEARTVGDLTVPAGGARYRYGSESGFPTGSFGRPSYFVDVEFRAGDQPLSIASRTPSAGAAEAEPDTVPSVQFSEAIGNGHTLALSLADAPVAGSQSLSADRRTLTFTPSAPLTLDRDYQVSLTGVVALADGAPLGDVTWSFRTRPARPVTVIDRTPAAGATGVSRSAPVSVTLSQPVANGWSMVVAGTGGPAAGSATRSADGRTLTFTPSGQLTADAGHTVTLSGVVSTEGAALGATSWAFRTAPRPTLTQSLFTGVTPASVTSSLFSMEAGTHFTPSTAGTITAVRFYKNVNDTGTHYVSVWRANGTRLVRVQVTGETASGWQQMNLPTPVSLTAGQSYVVSYTSPRGRVSMTSNYFSTASYVRGPLTATRAQNGRYRSLSTGQFPSSVSTGTSYFVDPVFQYLGP